MTALSSAAWVVHDVGLATAVGGNVSARSAAHSDAGPDIARSSTVEIRRGGAKGERDNATRFSQRRNQLLGIRGALRTTAAPCVSQRDWAPLSRSTCHRYYVAVPTPVVDRVWGTGARIATELAMGARPCPWRDGCTTHVRLLTSAENS